MKVFFNALLVLCVLSSATLAAEPADIPAPSLQQILDRYVDAAGGRTALEKIRTRVMKGQVEMTTLGASGDFLVLSKAPNLQVSSIEFNGFGSIREGYDGKVAWTAAPIQGVRRKTGTELARVQRSMVFPRELKLKESYERLEVKGPARAGTNDAWLVEAYPKEGKPDRLYFDRKSGLLIREESTVSTLAGEMIFQIDLGDYRDVEGVKVPFLMKVPQPAELGFQVRFTEVKQNVDLPDVEFGPPKE